jgi:tetratricopeptide (TPR) repeat protein
MEVRIEPPSGAFVGREREQGQLAAGLDAAVEGLGSLYLLVGEPGIGKSRLADEVASIARAKGFRVLWGRCWEAGGAPAYWPWVQSLRSYVREAVPTQLADDLGPGAGDVAVMLPDIVVTLPEVEVPRISDPAAARFRLFDAATSFLTRAAERSPILLVLDDLHSADTPSLLMLRFLAGEVGRARILVLGAYRDPDPERDGPLSPELGEIARQPTTHRVALSGLSEGHVGAFIERMVGRRASVALVRTIHAETEGNPLFVGEVVRLLESEGRFQGTSHGTLRLTIPDTVKDVIERRLARLSEKCRGLLVLGSVLGRDLPIDVLTRLAESDADEVLGRLDEATTARVLSESPMGLGAVRFAHALIRDTLYEELGTGRRIKLHRRAGEVLEELHGADESHLAEIAHHFLEAAAAGDVDRAVSYSRRAAQRAVELLAYEEAVRLSERALQALELTERPDEHVRCELLLVLGDAQARTGNTPGAKDTFLRASEIARRIGAKDELARAAIGYGGRFMWVRAGRDRRIEPLLEAALDALGEDDTAPRVRVLARLACALRDSPNHERSEALSALALEIAHRLDDPEALAYALRGRLGAIWWPENAAERLELADELARVAKGTGDLEIAYESHHARHICFFERGDLEAAERELASMMRIALELQQPTQSWFVDTLRALHAILRGELAEAERLTLGARELGELALLTDAESHFVAHMYMIRREQGRATEAMEELVNAARELMWYPFLRGMLADLHCQLGDGHGSRAIFDDLAVDNFATLPRDNEWLFALSMLSDVCVYLGDATRAEILYDLQQPYAHRNAVGYAEGCVGSVSRALGNLAALMGRYVDAERHFTEALQMNERMGALPWVAYTQHDLAKMFVDRDAPGDREAAIELLRDAESTCAALPMVALGGQVERLLRSLGASEAPQRGSTEAIEPRTAATLRREGEYWSIVFEGDAFRLRDSKGLRYLSHLLMAPGREIHALELVSAVEGHRPERASPTPRGEVTVDVGDAGELLDERAKAEYRARMLDLEAELSEAEEWNDPERASHVREERDFLARELAAAVGLGGRDRLAGSNAERARVNVTRAIKSALDRIQQHSPSLGRHLVATVRTGSFCSYQPDPRSTVSWSR